MSCNTTLGVVLLLACISFVVLGWSSQRDLGLLWDERVDLDIATQLLAHPLYGSGKDGSQMRLPMALTSLAFAITGPSLKVARAISLLAGVGAILATFGLARRLFGTRTALLAAVLLAFSPYFLAFGRTAMTEGDAFPPLFVTLACWAFIAYADRPSGQRLAVASLALGLAIAAKLYALLLIPVFGLCAFVRTRAVRPKRRSPETTNDGPPHGIRAWLVASAGCVVLAMAAAFAAQMRWVAASIALWVLLAFGVVSALSLLARNEGTWTKRLRAWGVLSLLGVGVAAAIVPEHVVHPDILRTVLRRTVYWDHIVPGTLWLDHLRLYFGIVAVFATPPVGVLMLTALGWGWLRETEQPALRVPTFVVSFHVLALTLLPLRQTFYLMSVWPMLCILAAAGLLAFERRLAAGLRGRRTGLLLTTVILGQLLWAAVSAWPDYNLYPRRWIGTRWLGSHAVGYRNLVQTPCDGYAELVDWCLRSVKPGERVVSYLWADHVLDALLPADLPFVFVRRGIYHAADNNLPLPPPPAIDDADVVLVHVNTRAEYDDMPPADVLETRFGGAPVFVVLRNGDFVIAKAYRRTVASSAGATSPPRPGSRASGGPTPASAP